MHQFPPQSKVWVYMADRVFTDIETQAITNAITDFTAQWTAHNMQLKATGLVYFNRFIVLMVDETQAGASGCSIDKSVHFIKQIETQLSVSLFNRQLIAYKKGEDINTFLLNEIDTYVANGELTPETVFFNNTVTTKQQFDEQWQQPIAQSWMKRYLPTQTT
ncbi:MAG: ABC transporter ATPase [Bacteroidota bacterium]